MKISTEARALGQAAIQERAKGHSADLQPVMNDLRAQGVTTLRGISEGLNARGIPTARGKGAWSAVQVSRVLERLTG